MNTKILVVDDRPDVRLSLLYMLQACGFDVSEAADGVQALEVIAKEHIEVVLTDLRMPGMDGRQLTRALTANPARPRIIVMSGAENFQRGEERTLGADAIITKPFTRDQLMRTIKATYQPREYAEPSFRGEIQKWGDLSR